MPHMEQKKNKSKQLQYVLHAAVILGLVWAAVKYINGEEVVAALQSFQYGLLPLMLLLSTLELLIKAGRFTLLTTPFAPDLPKSVIYKAYVSGQAATVLPGGIAMRAGLMKQAGVPLTKSSVTVIIHSLWDQAAFLFATLIAALWFPAARTPVLLITSVLAIGILLLLLPQTRTWLIATITKIAMRFNFAEQWQQFLAAVPQLFTRRIVLGSLLLTLIPFVSSIITLNLTMRGMGLPLPYPTLFLAYTLPTMLGRLLPLPGGGIGVTEAGMVGFLTTTAQINPDTAVAAVAIFRIVTIFYPILIGAIVYFLFWRGERESATNQETKLEVSRASNIDF